jgi:CHASE2 domain-containing sensor protein
MPVPPSAPTSSHNAERILRGIMLALVAWGVVQALGSWLYNHDPRRPLLVLACVGGFLGFWLAVLSARRRRLESK